MPPENQERETIGQKTEKLTSEKNRLMTELNEAPEENKAPIQEQIAVIERKLRWYAGRSGEGKAQRPSKGRKSKAPASEAPAQTPEPVASTGNES